MFLKKIADTVPLPLNIHKYTINGKTAKIRNCMQNQFLIFYTIKTETNFY